MSEKADIKELAVAAWRLEKWLDNLVTDRKMAAKSALRGIKKYISACSVEVKDPLGSKFDPGLAVEVVNNEDEDADENELIIVETLAPYVYQNGELIQHARVIIGTAVKEAKTNTGVIEENIAQADVPTVTSTLADDAQIIQETSDSDDNVTIGSDEIERMMAYAKIL